MTGKASISRGFAARISVKAITHRVADKARSAGRSQRPGIIDTKLQGYPS
jgi:hypothetical protein